MIGPLTVDPYLQVCRGAVALYGDLRDGLLDRI